MRVEPMPHIDLTICSAVSRGPTILNGELAAGAHAAVDVMKRGHDVRRRLVSRCFGRERPPHVAGYGDHGVAGRNGLGGEQAAPPAPGAERCSYTVAASCLGCESTLHRTHLAWFTTTLLAHGRPSQRLCTLY